MAVGVNNSDKALTAVEIDGKPWYAFSDDKVILPNTGSASVTVTMHFGGDKPAGRVVYSSKVLENVTNPGGILTASVVSKSMARVKFETDAPAVVLGAMDENRGRAALTVSFAKIVEHLKPKYFLMENVAVFEKSKTLKVVNNIFKNAGYGLTQLVLDASKCGVPQKRLRFITFGVLGGKDGDAEEIFKEGQSENSMTMRDYFGDSLGFQHYFRVPTNYSRRGIYSIDEPSMTIRGVDRPVPKGYKGHPADSAPLTPDIRTLTFQERSWVQTFPKDFVWEGSKTNINQIIGNAVPVKLAEYIANCIKKYIIVNEGN